MSDLTVKFLSARFMAYRKAPKKEPVVVAPVIAPRYEHDGYLSNAETKQERIDRIFAATQAGLTLGPLDTGFMLRCGDRETCYRRKQDRKMMRAADTATTRHENLILKLRDSERAAKQGWQGELGVKINNEWHRRQRAKAARVA